MGALIDIDHLMVHVPDSDAAGDIFSAMGFTVTPRSILPGLSNRLICFGRADPARGLCNYIELMSLDDAGTAPPPMPALLIRPGPVSTVLATEDARAARERLVAAGLRVPPVLDLQRDWHLPSGETITPAFVVAIPDLDQGPFYWNFCQHKTPRHYVRSDFVDHANGALALTSVIAVADDPGDAADHYRRCWQATCIGTNPVRVRLGKVDLLIHSPESYADRFTSDGAEPAGLRGFTVACASLSEARERVVANGIAVAEVAGGFMISPDNALGTLIVFEADGD
ncbi:MAG: VOC family protein [Pseudomonadota bacterium]